MTKKIGIIVPCYNEEESLPLFYKEMKRVMEQMDTQFELLFINDGSKYNTLKGSFILLIHDRFYDNIFLITKTKGQDFYSLFHHMPIPILSPSQNTLQRDTEVLNSKHTQTRNNGFSSLTTAETRPYIIRIAKLPLFSLTE